MEQQRGAGDERTAQGVPVPGELDREKHIAVVERLTAMVAAAAGDAALAERTWVLLTEAPDGGWGLAGRANTNAELVAAARAQIAELQARAQKSGDAQRTAGIPRVGCIRRSHVLTGRVGVGDAGVRRTKRSRTRVPARAAATRPDASPRAVPRRPSGSGSSSSPTGSRGCATSGDVAHHVDDGPSGGTGTATARGRWSWRRRREGGP